MHSLRGLTIVAGLLFLAVGAGAEPAVAPGYRLETVNVPGAAFAGMSRDGEALLVTDLASGRLYRGDLDGKLVAFGPVFSHGLDVIGDPTGPYRVVRAGDVLVVAQGWTPANSDAGPYSTTPSLRSMRLARSASSAAISGIRSTSSWRTASTT